VKLVIGENTYMYGDTDGRPLTEDLRFAAHTRKGQVRAAMSEAALAAHKAGKVQVALGRGSDFFGPWVLGSSHGERVFYPALAGKAASFGGKLDIPHTATYIEDFGKTLVILGEREEALGQAWHVPNDRPQITQRQFAELVFADLGKPAKVSAMGKTMMRIGGLFVPAARESVEMFYEFEKPFVVDSSKFERAFGVKATPIAEAIKATVAWYQAHPQAT
jgi:nucleoside-diphosphate-sugar epimerase